MHNEVKNEEFSQKMVFLYLAPFYKHSLLFIGKEKYYQIWWGGALKWKST
jgi:hypothetical protein